MHSYFWLISSGLKKPVRDDVPYTTQALREDLLRVRTVWEDCQASRERDAIYSYLTAVFNLVAWWTSDNRAFNRARKALRLRNIWVSDHIEPFAAVIRCTADRVKVDKRTRSKWSRVLGMRWHTKTLLSRWKSLSSGRLASTNAQNNPPGSGARTTNVVVGRASMPVAQGPGLELILSLNQDRPLQWVSQPRLLQARIVFVARPW